MQLELIHCLFGDPKVLEPEPSDVKLFKQALAWGAPLATTAWAVTTSAALQLPETPAWEVLHIWLISPCPPQGPEEATWKI